MKTGIKKVSSEYMSHRPNSGYDSVHFVVNHEVEHSDHIQVRPDIAERWRSTEDAIEYYAWVIEEIKTLQKELGVTPNKSLHTTPKDGRKN